MISQKKIKAQPFLKWARGKTQLLETIYNSLPSQINNNSFTYVELFVGIGAGI
jgi:DNA adenine methylase